MLKNNSLISVIVPVYNTKAYLGKCIKTIIDQSYKNLEIILIDDGSTDGTSVMCDEWSQKDARIKVFHLQNGGVSKARNFALEQCHGEWVSFVDSDDWLALDMYEILLALADKFEADTACCGAWQGNEENYIVRNIWRRFKEDEVCYNGGSALGNVIEQSGTLWNKLLKRELIGCIRFNEKIRYAEDTLFLSEYLLKANCVAVTKTPLYYYRINRLGNVVSGGLNSRHLDYLYATALIFDILRENGSVDVGVERVVDVGIRVARSEERRVGKECRSRWSPYH